MSSGTPSSSRVSASSTFVNEGLIRWEAQREQWLKGKGGKKTKSTEVRAKTVDVEDIIERIYSQTGNGKLPEPIQLGQMIDILIDFWEADGLYD